MAQSVPELPTSATMSLRQWSRLEEDMSGELVDGVLEEEEMPTLMHELIVTWLSAAFRSWLFGRGGAVGGSELKLAVGKDRGRKPDVVVYLPGKPRPPLRASLIDIPPTIVVEVVSATPRDARRDRVEKVDDYAAFGVAYYWILDPELRSLEIWELSHDGRYIRALGVTAGLLDKIPGCADLSLDLDALWTELDEPDEPS
jgi:Uma2 family endonuclease